MGNYTTFTTVTDNGPFITGLILHFDRVIRGTELPEDCFNVYAERRDSASGEVLPLPVMGAPGEGPASQGYRQMLDTYVCDAAGNRQSAGAYVRLTLAEEPLGKRTQGTMLESRYITCVNRVTQLKPIPAGEPGDAPIAGMVFDTPAGDICPQTEGWAIETAVYPGGERAGIPSTLGYAYFTPSRYAAKNILTPPRPLGETDKLPLVIWLHGAGEGGDDPWIAVTGNKVVNLSCEDIQRKLGGAAWVLAPQCPTVWMDDGAEQLGRSNRSIYVEPLKACIDDFIAAHLERIDLNRILIGGDSNGGFMTVRMILDYPEFFAAAFPACQAFYNENVTEPMLRRIRDLPIWFIHSRQDELVPPRETSLPLYHRLIAAGAKDAHLCYLDHMEDLTGMYKDGCGRPQLIFNHAVWIHVYNDQIDTDLDGRRVLVDGEPATLFEWLGAKSRARRSAAL